MGDVPTFAPTMAPTEVETNNAIGVTLCLIGALTGAMSMNVQQMALSTKEWSKAKGDAVWLCGILLYLVSQVISVISLTYSPLSLMAALFTTMLFFDAGIGFFLLGKTVTKQDLAGLCVIFFSVMIIAFFGPKAQYDVTADKMVEWISAMSGAVVVVLLPTIFASCFISYKLFNHLFPKFRISDDESENDQPPVSYELMMMFVYPAILGTCESVGQLSLKAVSSMLAVTSAGNSQLKSPVFYICLVVWLTCVVNTIVWLRTVYAKFETVECLPVEYGLVAALSITASLLFYQEHKDPLCNVTACSCAVAGIIVGIVIIISGKKEVLASKRPGYMPKGSITAGEMPKWKTVEERRMIANLRGVGISRPQPKLKNAVNKLIMARRLSTRGFAPGGAGQENNLQIDNNHKKLVI
jgi:drug/metabolite transporter (DMT)-like permease